MHKPTIRTTFKAQLGGVSTSSVSPPWCPELSHLPELASVPATRSLPSPLQPGLSAPKSPLLQGPAYVAPPRFVPSLSTRSSRLISESAGGAEPPPALGGNVRRVRGPLPPALPRVPGQSAGASHLPVIVTRAAAKVEVQTSAGVPGLTSGCKELLGHVFRVGTLRAAFLSGRPMSRSHARLRLHPGNSEIVIFIIIQTFF